MQWIEAFQIVKPRIVQVANLVFGGKFSAGRSKVSNFDQMVRECEHWATKTADGEDRKNLPSDGKGLGGIGTQRAQRIQDCAACWQSMIARGSAKESEQFCTVPCAYKSYLRYITDSDLAQASVAESPVVLPPETAGAANDIFRIHT